MGMILLLHLHASISQCLISIINIVPSKLLRRTENSFHKGANNALNHVLLLISVIETRAIQRLLLEIEKMCERSSDDKNTAASNT